MQNNHERKLENCGVLNVLSKGFPGENQEIYRNLVMVAGNTQKMLNP